MALREELSELEQNPAYRTACKNIMRNLGRAHAMKAIEQKADHDHAFAHLEGVLMQEHDYRAKYWNFARSEFWQVIEAR
jgi:hypothetical protein